VDAAALASKVISVLMPFVTTGVEEFTRAAGKAAYEKIQSLIATLKKKWAGDSEASQNLTRFEEKPDRYKLVLEDILKEKVSKDRDLADQLERMLGELGPEIDIIQKMKFGERIVGLDADDMRSGQARVKQEIDEAKDVTAAKIKRIGS